MKRIQKIGKLYEGLPFFAMVCALVILYIANVYGAEKKIRRIDRLDKQIETLKREYISVTAKSVDNGRLFEVAKSINGVDVTKEVRIPKRIDKTDA